MSQFRHSVKVRSMNANNDAATLTKAVVTAAERLGMLDALPEILGVSMQTVAGMKAGTGSLDPGGRAWQAATRFASLFRSLITLLGDVERARTWLNESHQTLGDSPAQLLRAPGGLDRVVSYLDAVQKYEIKLPPRSH